MKKVQIDIVSDVACPWCYIGLKRIETAMAECPNVDIEVNWKAYQLDPTIPVQGYEIEAFFTRKFGGKEQALEVFDHVAKIGKEEGINFDFINMPRVINTFPLHVLLTAAAKQGKKYWLKSKLFKANFEEKLDLSNTDVLASIVAELGWDKTQLIEILNDVDLQHETKDEIDHYQKNGVSSVPFFIINQKYGISGAQQAEAFVKAIMHVAQEG
jgi:predicted DsbA family dithiol-disulfide isomerase